MSTPALRLDPADADPDEVVFVDGTRAGYRCLSHWPGQITPPSLRHDLSTGSALLWARLGADARHASLGPFSVVANTHYDTDGVLSTFAVRHPDVALEHEDLLLRAAATGDFATWNGRDALALELLLMGLVEPGTPPLDLPADTPDAERWLAGYEHAHAELPRWLRDPVAAAARHGERLDRVTAEVEAIDRAFELGADDLFVEPHADVDLAVVTTTRDLTVIGWHRAAGDASRVLMVRPGDDGWRYRLVYRTTSWFELVSRAATPRPDLAALVERLRALDARAPWWCTDTAMPVAQLGCAPPADRDTTFYADPRLDRDAPTELEPRDVVALLREVFAAG